MSKNFPYDCLDCIHLHVIASEELGECRRVALFKCNSEEATACSCCYEKRRILK